jgi:hypothetical protein
MHNNHHFVKKKSQVTWSKENYGIFKEKPPNFNEKIYEIVKIFGGFWEISNFFLLKFLFKGPNGSPTCDRIPRYSPSLFVL